MSSSEPLGERRGPRRVHLIASSGYPNYGDELITAIWLRRIAEQLPDAEVWVDTPSPGLSSVLFEGLHPRVRFVDTLWRLCWAAPSEQPWEVAAWVDGAVGDVGRAPKWALATEALREADLLHVIGGGYLHGEWPRHVGLLSGVLAAARLSGARTALTGQGLAPVLPDTAPLLAELVRRFDVVDVRDEASEAALREGGVEHAELTCDDVFLGLADPAAHIRPGVPRFMLCAQADMLAGTRTELAGLVARTLRAWEVDPAELGVVEGIPGLDREVYALLEYQLPGARFYPFSEIWRDGLPVAPGQTWLSTRFHPHLVAASVGASGAALPVSPGYYLTKHRSLVNQGSRWTIVDSPGVPPLPTQGGFPPEVVRALHAAKTRLADRVYGVPLAAPTSAPPRLPADAAERSRRWSLRVR